MLFSPRRNPILQFWAQTITLSFDRQCRRPTVRTNFTVVHSGHCQSCGSVQFDSELGAEGPDSRAADVIILSKAVRSDKAGSPVHVSNPVDPDGPLYWVMVVEWEGNLATRKGLGFVFQDCLAAAQPGDVVWKEIALI